ncbi:MAG TPA: sigma 54-interacting transcriptional regulator [Pirellulales bacterium]|jgi:PAS domain S-box-containing protein|nr:sigma 54-interacting transcriptional regulator [Pirellulales bacterium]
MIRPPSEPLFSSGADLDALVAGSSNDADAAEIAALRTILDGTAHSTGEAFFRSLVRHLATALGVQYAFVAEFADVNTRVRTLAYWFGDRFHDNVEFDLPGTPCQEVLRGKLCHYPRDVQRIFPADHELIDLGIESYLGVPLLDAGGVTLGHLAVFDTRAMSAEPKRLYTFRIFAARAAAELERLRAEKLHRESEQRFRDLYEEAPIAYVLEDLETRFVSANRAAMRILGIKPEEVAGTVGRSLVPDTPEAQRRVKEALASIGRGADARGVVLELCRKDNGQPVWVQWWSKPMPGGKYTRTMFVDITDRVLAEQDRNRLQQQNAYLQEEIQSVHDFEEIIGQSSTLSAVLDNTRLVAPTDTSVLITGETGTGKELVARAIHSASTRRDKPLIKVNCAALPTGLVESELFGHEKGAFTGAISRRIGRFELAAGGTIFLDEIGEIPLDVQAKLLRILQEREFERLGGSQTIKVDVRIIAATNRDLLKAVREKTFREDLYYRLSVFPVALPPLRQRPDDIPLLAQFLVNKFAMRIGKRLTGISPQSIERLLAYTWPGNVRELENVLERAVILCQGPILEIDPALVSESGPLAAEAAQPATATNVPSTLSLQDVESAHIRSVLERTNWVIDGNRGAATLLELHPNTLRSRMKKLGISR